MVPIVGGDLHQAIQKRQSDKTRSYFSEMEIMEWFCQISLALQYTHQKNILHRDLKTQNIFLTGTKIVKLGDFGIAKVLNSDTEFAKTIIGTPYYLSPEMCEDQPYDSKSDIWALGCVLYEMATLRHAFDAHNLPALVLKILKGDYPPIPQVYSKDLSNLVKSMLRTDPRERPSINEILATALVQKYLSNVKQRIVTPRRPGIPIPRKPTTSSGDREPTKKSSPEKLQILKLRNEPKAKSKENLKKVLNSTGRSSPSTKIRPLPPKSTKSPSPSPSLPSTPRTQATNKAIASPRNPPNKAIASPRTSGLGVTSPRNPALGRMSPRTPNMAVASPRTPASANSNASSSASASASATPESPRSRTPPVVTPPLSLTPHSQQNSPRPYSSPAVSHRSNSTSNTPDPVHVPTPRPPTVTPPDKKIFTHQRAKSEPLKRSVPVLAGRKPSVPSALAAPPKPPPLIAKKRTPLKLELKQHEQKFKDNLKSVKARIARDNKPFQNAIKQEEQPLSPTSAASSQLLFIIPPSSPPPNGTVSAPVTPRAPASTQDAAAKPVTRTRAATSTPAARSPVSASGSPASASSSPASAQALRSTTGAAALKAVASSAAIMRKQKSFTEKTETLKEIIKKSRRQIRKEGGGDVSVEIVVPKHMEHLLHSPDLESVVPDLSSTGDVPEGSPDSETCSMPKEEEAKEENVEKDTEDKKEEEEREGKKEEVEVEGERNGKEETGVEKEEGKEVERTEKQKEEKETETTEIEAGKEEEREKEVEKEKEIEKEAEEGERVGERNEQEENVNKKESVVEQTTGETPRSRESVRFSTDLSKMDKLSIRIETLRQKCEQVFGEETFFKVYKYLREMKQDADDKEIQNTLHKMVGNEKLAYMRYVDQLIFCELQFYGS